MKKKRRLIAWIIAVPLIVVFCVLSAIRYNIVNAQYPSPRTIASGIHAPLEVNGISYLSKNIRIVPKEDFLKENNIDPKLTAKVGNEEKIVLVDLQMTNKSDEQKTIELYNFYLKSDTWSQGLEPSYFHAINGEKTVTVTLKKMQIYNVVLSFNASDVQFYKEDWSKFDSRKFQLVLSFYPFKNVLQLN